MTYQQYPITPPLELIYEWVTEVCPEYGKGVHFIEEHVATKAAQWGADQELKACCKLLSGADIVPPDGAKTYPENVLATRERVAKLRALRRPKPKSQAEEALEALDAEDSRRLWSSKTEKRFDTIRAALERLRELEGDND